MSTVSQIVMNENLPNSADTYTSTEFNAVLGGAKWFSITLLVDNTVVTSTGAFDLFVEESSDGRVWTQRNDTTQATTPPASGGTGDISIVPTNGTVYLKRFSDACQGVSKPGSAGAGPLLQFVRLHLKTNATTACHVKIIYNGRD